MEKLKSMEKEAEKICKNDRIIPNTPVLPSGDGLGTIFFQPLVSAPISSGFIYVWMFGRSIIFFILLETFLYIDKLFLKYYFRGHITLENKHPLHTIVYCNAFFCAGQNCFSQWGWWVGGN